MWYRLNDEHLSKQVLFGKLVIGQRLAGGQKKDCTKYKDSTKTALKKWHISKQWQ